jgi:hypothetical protein
MEKAFGRSITANGLSIGEMLLCGSAIGGRVVLSTLKIIWLSRISILSVTDVCYS